MVETTLKITLSYKLLWKKIHFIWTSFQACIIQYKAYMYVLYKNSPNVNILSHFCLTILWIVCFCTCKWWNSVYNINHFMQIENLVPFYPSVFHGVYFLKNLVILLLSIYSYPNQEITINIVVTVCRPCSILANHPNVLCSKRKFSCPISWVSYNLQEFLSICLLWSE